MFAVIMEKEEKSIVYHRDVIEFVTVAVQYCLFIETANNKTRKEFVETLLKIIPLLYLKGVMLPKPSESDEEYTEDYVTEENYNIVRSNISFVMGEQDDYLDVFIEDMKYSEHPILMTISENLSDIYQDVKNFVCVYKEGTEERMNDAISLCKYNFENYWGQKATNVLRALHDVRYNQENEYEEEDDDYAEREI